MDDSDRKPYSTPDEDEAVCERLDIDIIFGNPIATHELSIPYADPNRLPRVVVENILYIGKKYFVAGVPVCHISDASFYNPFSYIKDYLSTQARSYTTREEAPVSKPGRFVLEMQAYLCARILHYVDLAVTISGSLCKAYSVGAGENLDMLYHLYRPICPQIQTPVSSSPYGPSNNSSEGQKPP